MSLGMAASIFPGNRFLFQGYTSFYFNLSYFSKRIKREISILPKAPGFWECEDTTCLFSPFPLSSVPMTPLLSRLCAPETFSGKWPLSWDWCPLASVSSLLPLFSGLFSKKVDGILHEAKVICFHICQIWKALRLWDIGIKTVGGWGNVFV